MPVYHAPKEVPPLKFRMVVGRTAVITQSSSQNNSLLQEFVSDNRLWIHPEPAGKLGIAHGDRVRVESPVGTQKLEANVTYKTRPDTVYMHTGFGVLSQGSEEPEREGRLHCGGD